MLKQVISIPNTDVKMGWSESKVSDGVRVAEAGLTAAYDIYAPLNYPTHDYPTAIGIPAVRSGKISDLYKRIILRNI